MGKRVASWIALGLAGCAACAAHDTSGSAEAIVPPREATPTNALYYFTATADVTGRLLDVTYRTPKGDVTPQATPLPYGNLCNQVYLHTLQNTVDWQNACGTTTLCGQVELVNMFAGSVQNATAVIDSVSPTTVTAVGAPYSYGTVSANSTSAPITWSFFDPTSDPFTFAGHVEGVPPAIGYTSVPGCYDFGNVVIYGLPPMQNFHITNNTGATSGTLIAVLSNAMPGFSIMSNSCDGHTLAAGASCDIAVTMQTSNQSTPTSPGVGQKFNDLSVTDPSHVGSGVTVALAGTLTCGPKGNQCYVNSDCCSGSCNVPTSPLCN